MRARDSKGRFIKKILRKLKKNQKKGVVVVIVKEDLFKRINIK